MSAIARDVRIIVFALGLTSSPAGLRGLDIGLERSFCLSHSPCSKHSGPITSRVAREVTLTGPLTACWSDIRYVWRGPTHRRSDDHGGWCRATLSWRSTSVYSPVRAELPYVMSWCRRQSWEFLAHVHMSTMGNSREGDWHCPALPLLLPPLVRCTSAHSAKHYRIWYEVGEMAR